MNGIPLHNMADVWDNTVAKFPNKTAAIAEGAAYSYQELDVRVRALAGNLVRQFGLAPGEHVAIAAPNCLEFFIAYWAVVRTGATLVPVNIRLRPDGMAYVLRHGEASVLIVHRDVWKKLSPELADLPQIGRLIGIGFADDQITPFEDLLTGEGIEPAAVGEEDRLLIVYTSGTTGRPKGAVITHGNLLFNIKNTIIPHGFRHEDVHLVVVPLFHCTGLNSIVPTSAYLGGTVVIAPRPAVKELVELIARHRITTFLGVPTLFHLLTTFRGLKDYDLSSLRLIAYSGSPMREATIRRLRERFPHVALHNFFGLTETTSITHVLANGEALAKHDSIGKLLPDVGMRLVDQDGNDVPVGAVGELLFHKNNVITTYWREPERLAEAMVGDYFRTGDFARVDEDGYVFLKGRKKEMIIVGGENVYALEVENAITSHEEVLEAAVVGVEATGAATYLGELVKAFVVPQEGRTPTELELKRHCHERLPSYAVPHQVVLLDRLPRSPSGKVLKQELKPR